MNPTFPPYVLLSDIKVLSHEGQMLFTLSFAGVRGGAREITLSQDMLQVLWLADGSRDVDVIVSEVLCGIDRATSQKREQLYAGLDQLLEFGVLIDSQRLECYSQNARYSRHDLFFCMVDADPNAAQKYLKDAKIVVFGVGGIGTWSTQLLAAAGIGYIELVDDDKIELSNLTRQTLFSERDIGASKVETAAKRLRTLNSTITIEPRQRRVRCVDDALDLLSGKTFAIVSADQPYALQEWIDEAAWQLGVPWTAAGYVGAKGVSGPLIAPGFSLCLRCFRAPRGRAMASGDELDQLPLFGDLVRRHQPPSFGPLNGIIASITAGQVLLWLAGKRDNVQTLGRRLVFDAISLKSEFLSTEALKDCPRCSAYSLDVRNMDEEIRKNVNET